jgi:hypothetical protein
MLVSAMIRGPTRRLFRGKKFVKEVRPEVAALRTTPLKIEEYSTYTRHQNYNLEEQQKYSAKLVAATEQRNLIQELEQKTILPRRRRRIYDRPRYDLDISNYDCFRNIEDLVLKWSPHMFAVCCKVLAPPALVEKAFGRGLTAFRNGHYSTKEWDFTDSNFDQFLVYDYKGTSEFWGPNKTPQEYEVAVHHPVPPSHQSEAVLGQALPLQRRLLGRRREQPRVQGQLQRPRRVPEVQAVVLQEDRGGQDRSQKLPRESHREVRAGRDAL